MTRPIQARHANETTEPFVEGPDGDIRVKCPFCSAPWIVWPIRLDSMRCKHLVSFGEESATFRAEL